MAMTIKTIEQTIPVSRDMETIQLLHKEELRRYFDKYKYVHLGMVQVAVKPLTAQGLNTSVLIALRDCRHLEFKDSLLGIIQTSLCNGPVYFNCFPNFSVSLTDKNILDVLTLNVKTHGYKLKEGTEPLNITYRVYYKAMTTLSPRAKIFDTKGKTVLIETNNHVLFVDKF